MKTLQDFKDEVAKEKGYKDWKQLNDLNFFNITNKWTDLASERYAEYIAICFCEELKKYTAESKTILGFDERSGKELYDIFRQNKQ